MVPKAKFEKLAFLTGSAKSAAELRFGVKSPDDIVLTPLNSESQEAAEQIEHVLKTPVAMH
jgi:hypothetical protein